MNEIKKKKYNIKVVNPAEREQYISDNDMEMDLRASAAVKAALNKAEICKKPIAKYDKEKKKAYVTINQLEEMRTWTIKKGI